MAWWIECGERECKEQGRNGSSKEDAKEDATVTATVTATGSEQGGMAPLAVLQAWEKANARRRSGAGGAPVPGLCSSGYGTWGYRRNLSWPLEYGVWWRNPVRVYSTGVQKQERAFVLLH